MYDLIIIGSGPAGLSAAVYGKRAGLGLLVIDRNPMGGGQVLNTYEVDNYLGLPGMNGFDMGMKFKEHAEAMGAEFKKAAVTAIRVQDGKKVVETADKTSYEAKALILAAGAKHARLNVPGEAEYKGKGVSYCATCDGAFFKGREVAVVGGGDVAAEDAVYLSRMCKKVWLVHRRDCLRAAKNLQEQLFACENVEVLWNQTVLEIHGNGLVDGITLHNVKTDSDSKLTVEGVFIAVGMEPDTEAFRGVVECDEAGYIIAGEDCAASVPGIYAAGDIRTKKVRQIVTAVADGACAVASAEKFLS